MKVRFTAGELAAICGVSKQTLLYYDREGIFSPRERGKNGYRYYTAEQLEILDSILILRELDVPLREIREHMQNPSLSSTVDLLQKQHEALEAKVHRLTLLEKQISRKLETLLHPVPLSSPQIMELPEEYLLVEPVEGEKNLLKLDICLKRLLCSARDLGYPHSAQIGSIGLYSNIANGIFDRYEYGYLPLTVPARGSHIFLKPAGKYGLIYWEGDYRDLSLGYQCLSNYVQSQGYEPFGYTYEYNILDSLTNAAPCDYVTQIQVALRPLP